MTEKETFQVEITPEHKLFDFHLKELMNAKDLVFLFVKRDFTSLYKQTILGPMWAIIQPLLTTIVFTVVFGNLAKLTTADIPGDFAVPVFLFYMSGNICWTYFANTLTATSNTFIANRSTMGKVYYPRIVAPISTAISNLISFAIQFVMFFMICCYYLLQGNTAIHMTPWIFLLPPLILQTMLLSVGTGIIISSVTTKYRDLQKMVGFGVQLWQYASPIAYGLELVPKNYLPLYMLNPITPIITSFRKAMLGFGFFDITYYIISWIVTLVIFLIGLILFNRIERTFMDTI